MGLFKIEIDGMGRHGCDQYSIAGEPLKTRCMRLSCVDCLTFDFVQMLRQKGYRVRSATFTHHVGATDPSVVVVDDLLLNERKSGRF